MKIDMYTKAVLTVIALCLVWLSLNRTPVVSAQAGPMPVMIVDQRGQPVIGPFGLRVNAGDQPWPVVINQSVPVSLIAIERRGSWQPLPVDVLKTPPTLRPGP